MFGYLYLAEKKSRGELKDAIKELEGHSNWCEKVVRMGSPAIEDKELKAKCSHYIAFLFDVKRAAETAPVSHLRVYVEKVKELAALVKRLESLPPPPAVMKEPALSGYRPVNVYFGDWVYF